MTPVEQVKQILMELGDDPTLTLSQYAEKSERTATDILKILAIKRHSPSVLKAVKAGEMPLVNGYVMYTVPKDKQDDWIERAKSMPIGDFNALVRSTFGRRNKQQLTNNS